MKPLFFKKKLLLSAVILLNLIYIIWRVFFTLPDTRSPFSLFFAIGLLVSELLGFFELFMTADGIKHQFVPTLPTADPDTFPEVDVFIATYNEDIALVRKTVLGCKNMHYPDKRKVHIFVCDDGRRAEMANMAASLGVGYLTREGNHGAKAGNLNNALQHTTAPLIVTFDADMIPMEHFLLETVPYFLVPEANVQPPRRKARFGRGAQDVEPKGIGFIQTPQSFYNADLFQTRFFSTQRIPNEQDYFYRNIQTTKNHTNTVIYGGSNTVIARKALAEIGGFYTESITEDFATGILIQSKGYACYATETVLASGLSPHDMKSLFSQRERWARGCIQTIQKLRIFCLPGLTLMQKLSYFASISYWYSCVKRFFYIACPIAFSVFGVQVLDASFTEILLFFLPTYLFTNFILGQYASRIRTTRWTNIYETILFPSLLKAVLLETFGISQKKFSVTDKSGKLGYEAAYHAKKSRIFYGYLALSCVGVFNILWYLPTYQTLNFTIILYWLVINLGYLCMATLFVRGRAHEETDVHYTAVLALTLTQGETAIHAETQTIAEDYVTFAYNGALPFAQHAPIQVQLAAQGRYQAYLCACSAHAAPSMSPCQPARTGEGNSADTVQHYRCTITPTHAQEQDAWHVMLHNRLPSLPQVMAQHGTLLTDLQHNLVQRYQART